MRMQPRPICPGRARRAVQVLQTVSAHYPRHGGRTHGDLYRANESRAGTGAPRTSEIDDPQADCSAENEAANVAVSSCPSCRDHPGRVPERSPQHATRPARGGGLSIASHASSRADGRPAAARFLRLARRRAASPLQHTWYANRYICSLIEGSTKVSLKYARRLVTQPCTRGQPPSLTGRNA